ncbi:caspase domain-containing protein, partial [Schizophyllum commune]
LVLLRSDRHILCASAPLPSVDKDAAVAMSDSGANSEVERYPSSSVTSSETSLSDATDIRGRRMNSALSHVKKLREALMVPAQVAKSIVSADFEPSLCTGSSVIGINYEQSSSKVKRDYGVLEGCIKDTKDVENYLIGRLLLRYLEGFDKADIRMLTDEDTTADNLKPTKENILAAIRWLRQGAQKHDTLFFHCTYCDQVPDLDKDEVDRLDEALVPCDFQTVSDFLTDDVIYTELVEPLPKGCRLTVSLQSCTSGTAFDLPCAYRVPLLPRSPGDEQVVHQYQPLTCRLPPRTCADVVFWSGCKDGHNAADEPTMTSAFIRAMTESKSEGTAFTYKRMIQSLRDYVYDQPIGREKQKPQLGSLCPVKMETPFFITPPNEASLP